MTCKKIFHEHPSSTDGFSVVILSSIEEWLRVTVARIRIKGTDRVGVKNRGIRYVSVSILCAPGRPKQWRRWPRLCHLPAAVAASVCELCEAAIWSCPPSIPSVPRSHCVCIQGRHAVRTAFCSQATIWRSRVSGLTGRQDSRARLRQNRACVSLLRSRCSALSLRSRRRPVFCGACEATRR
jgi:hypothetical protein